MGVHKLPHANPETSCKRDLNRRGSKCAVQESTELPLAWLCYHVSISLMWTRKPNFTVNLTVGLETTWVCDCLLDLT